MIRLCATAVAKYCAKRVPGSCTVLAVSKGEIVYHGNAMQEEMNHCCTSKLPMQFLLNFLVAYLLIFWGQVQIG
jgi:hypothetical protein